MTGDVVVVTDPGGSQRQLLARLGSLVRRSGGELLLRSHADLVDETSLLIGADGLVRVSPDRPILWLWPHPEPIADERQERFLRVETLNAARSICMLSESAVFNRPTPLASVGALPPSRAMAMRVASLVEPAVRPECFGTVVPEQPSPEQPGPQQPLPDKEVYDYSSGRAHSGRPETPGPYRWREGANGHPVTVHVVGGRVIGVPAGDELAAASVALAERFSLDFVAVTWLRGPEPVLARLSAELTDNLIGARSPEIAEAIGAWLRTHRAVRA